jgi:cyanophycin synthetase
MMQGDCTGPVSAEFVLKDPTVNFAVLETARGGMLRAGLGFHNCDVAVVTNVAPDHLGLQGIDSLEKLARVKAVPARTVFPEGYTVLNADDDLVFKMKNDLDCKVALFSLDENNPRIIEHCSTGGLACVSENGYVTIMKGNWKMRIEKVVNIPITFDGKAEFNIANTLAAVMACFVRDFRIEDIRQALLTFVPSPAQTPGRLNMFKFRHFTVMLDYAHNAHGMRAIGKLVNRIEASKKVGIIAGVGDRRDEDTIELAAEAAHVFDEIIIRQDKNLRGRPVDEIIGLLKKGIMSVKPNMKVEVIHKESEAIDYAIKNAEKNSFITVISDVVPDALEQVKMLREAEEEKHENLSQNQLG